MLGEFLELRIKDPGTGAISRRKVEDRTFGYFQNMGQALVHWDHPEGPVAFTNFEDLRSMYHPDNVYRIVNRKCAYVSTYEVALGVVKDPLEPFTHLDGLKYTKDITCITLNINRQGPDFPLVEDFYKKYKYRPPRLAQIDIDGLWVGDQHSALLTTFRGTPELAEVRNWALHCQFFHYFQANTRDAASAHAKQWKRVFDSQVHLYVGFSVPRLTTLQFAELTKMRVKPLVRQGMRYVLCRI